MCMLGGDKTKMAESTVNAMSQLCDAHKAQLEKYLKFYKTRHDGHLIEVGREFSDIKLQYDNTFCKCTIHVHLLTFIINTCNIQYQLQDNVRHEIKSCLI